MMIRIFSSLSPLWKNVLLRTLTALILAPLVLLDIWVGSFWFLGLLLIFGLGLALEWCVMIHPSPGRPFLWYAGTLALLLSFAWMGAFKAAFLSFFVVWGGYLLWLWFVSLPRSFWTVIGFPYILLPILSLSFLRFDRQDDCFLLLYLLGVVWACDTCAFIVGRSLGGPKLWPKISPNKTWAGLFGAMAGGGGVSVLFSFALAHSDRGWFFLYGIALALVEQAGDFFESAAKRAYGVKDSSHLIPGHGGLLDRMDGVMFAAVAMAISILWLKAL